MFDHIAARVNGDATLIRRGRHVNVTLLLEAGDQGSIVRIVDGRIAGSEFTVRKGLGHFPMSKHPGRFLSYLLPVLEKIRATP